MQSQDSLNSNSLKFQKFVCMENGEDSTGTMSGLAGITRSQRLLLVLANTAASHLLSGS